MANLNYKQIAMTQLGFTLADLRDLSRREQIAELAAELKAEATKSRSTDTVRQSTVASMQSREMRKQDFDKLYSNFRYSKFQKLCRSLGASLNGRKDRFDKSDIIEMGFEKASGGSLKWVDEQGCDLYDQENDLRYEVKSQDGSLFTKKTNKKKKNTGCIKLTNTLRQGKKALNETADYLIIVNTNTGSFGITTYKTAIEYSTERDDGFSTRIPLDEIEIIHHDLKNNPSKQNTGSTYKEQKINMQKTYVGRYFNEEN